MISFRTKMIGGIALIEGVFLLAILLSSLRLLEHAGSVQMAKRVRGEAQLLASAAENGVLASDVASLAALAHEALANPGIAYVRIFDGQGHLLAEAHGRLRGDRNALLRAVRAITVSGVSYGHVEVGLSTRHMSRLSRSLRSKVALIAVADMALVALFSYLLGAYLTRELKALQLGAERIAQGEIGYQLCARGRDELGQTTAAFNQMSQQLLRLEQERERQRAQLAALNQDLERRVSERTLELAHANQELKYRALHDPLTGLPNRLLLQDRLDQMLKRAARAARSATLMIMDLDGFKEVNDTLGHQTGDALLQALGRGLAAALRQSDTVGRLGGDEFAFLFPEADREAVPGLAIKILEVLAHPVSLGDHRLVTRASVGIALFPDHGVAAPELLHAADLAMYEAKRRGGGYWVYEPALDPGRAEAGLGLPRDLDLP